MFSDAVQRVDDADDAWNNRCGSKKVRALGLVYIDLRPANPIRLGTQDDQSYLRTTVEVGTCGDDSRPSRDEVAALACAMLDSMWHERLSINDEQPRRDNNIFPVSYLVTNF